jgi:serine/threonine protein kinase
MVHGLQNSLIITRDGKSILATNVWKENSVVSYKDGATVKTLPAHDVSEIINGSLSDPSCYYPLLSRYLRVSLANGFGMTSPGTLAKIARHPIYKLVKPYLDLIACILFVLLLLLVGFYSWRRYPRPKSLPPSAPVDETTLLRLADFSDVESLFLSIFKKKLGAPDSAPSKIRKVSRSGNRSKQLLNLKVFYENKWHSRRMTLSPIGEGSGSKSQCFYVIFDTHMVIKIPPTPITDFDNYIARVKAERKIMQRLEPRICVIPHIAVILERIHSFTDADTAPPEFIENRYVRWLHNFPKNQRFLTINGSFVFFMDLARYYFLSHVTADFHNIDAGLAEEIGADIDNLSDISEFEGKYGRWGGELWPTLYKSYESFRKEFGEGIARAETPVSLPERNIKGMFLSSMAGQDPHPADLNIPDDLKALLEKLLAEAVRSGKELRQRYRKILIHYTKQRFFTRNRQLMGGMVTNLLDLLSWTGQQQVSLRDLKPDNLLVAGNSENYPHFLSSPRDYTIGLIDLETAVYFGNSPPSKIPQPQLGGTPFYCTPSHFFPNPVLEAVYGDLPLVLHLQDWYAMMAIIFEVVTGEKLFKKTACLLPTMMKAVRRTAKQKGDLKTPLLNFTHQFRESARNEIRAKSKLYAGWLKAVSTHIVKNIRQQLLEYQQTTLQAQQQELNQLLDNYPAFNEGSNRQWFEKSSVADLEKLQARYQNREGGAKLTESIGQVIDLRKKNDTLTAHIQKLTRPESRIPIDTLLEMMFSLVEKKLLTDLTLPAPEPAPETPTAEEANEEELAKTVEILDYSATIQVTG